MYLWKCWRDTRGAFFAVLGAVLAVGAFGVYVVLDPFGWIAAKPLESRTAWQFSADALLRAMPKVVVVAALVLGALGVGTEFEKGTADFLLTRARPRWHFLWTSWGLGAAQMVVLMLVSNLFRLARVGPDRVEGLGDFLGTLVAFCTSALVCYTATYLMTTLARSSGKGTVLAMAVLLGYGWSYAGLKVWYHIDIPFFLELSFRDADFPLTVAGWLAVCLALMLVAQFRLERAEV
jgi:hypothetical protein